METNTPDSTENALVRWFPWLTAVTGALIVVQAFLAGRGLFKGADIEIHGMVGNATFIAVVLVVVGAWLGRQSGALGTRELALSVLLLVLLIAQLALGYSGRTNLDSAALHIPNGVLISGITSALIALGFSRRPI